MTDTIRGPVIEVITGDTFKLRVTHIGQNNKEEYDNLEIVKIADLDAPELNVPEGKKAKEALERKLKDKQVRCYVQTRDKYGRVVAEYEILPEESEFTISKAKLGEV